MNSIDHDKVRALLLCRTRRALAGNEAMRWDRIASAILSVAASARLLRDVADFAQATGNPQAAEAGRTVEAAIVNAIADAIGVDVLAAIKKEAEPPKVFEGAAVYELEPGRVVILPDGFDVVSIDSRPAFYLTDDEARVAFEAIAARRLWAKCECEASTGYGCPRCKRACERMRRDPDFDPVQRIAEVAHRWASIMLKRRRVGGAA